MYSPGIDTTGRGRRREDARAGLPNSAPWDAGNGTQVTVGLARCSSAVCAQGLEPAAPLLVALAARRIPCALAGRRGLAGEVPVRLVLDTVCAAANPADDSSFLALLQAAEESNPACSSALRLLRQHQVAACLAGAAGEGASLLACARSACRAWLRRRRAELLACGRAACQLQQQRQQGQQEPDNIETWAEEALGVAGDGDDGSWPSLAGRARCSSSSSSSSRTGWPQKRQACGLLYAPCWSARRSTDRPKPRRRQRPPPTAQPPCRPSSHRCSLVGRGAI